MFREQCERLAELLGWRGLHWNVDLLTGHAGDTEPLGGGYTFPPSAGNGDGMLWLIQQCAKKEVYLSAMHTDPKHLGEDTNEWSVTAEYGRREVLECTCAYPEELPVIAVHAAHDALEKLSDRGEL